MTHVTEKLDEVRRRICAAATRFGRDPGTIQLVAVSKQHSVASIREALEAGQRDFGENYVQDALPKIAELGPETARWHFIGPVQSNKTRHIAAHFHWVHTIDRVKIARRLSEQRSHHAPPLQVCIEVNVTAEATKAGIAPEEVGELARIVTELPRLRLRGLMCLPPPEADFERQRLPFRRLRQCLDELRAAGYELDTLSMGMTNDLEAAIAEGATLVRVGTAVFGPRPGTGSQPA